MHIVYTIGCFAGVNTGFGGHYRSLLSLAEVYAVFRPEVMITIVSFGNHQPSVFQNIKLPYHHIHITASDLFHHIDIDFKQKPTHIHAFDRRSLFFSQQLAKKYHAKIYLTKPGGPNTRYTPQVPDMVYFSQENIESISHKSWYSKVNVHYFPQRVQKVKADTLRLNTLRALLPTDSKKILRIARIGDSYIQSIKQTLNLAQILRQHNINVQAVIIGVVEKQETLEQIESFKSAEDVIITDSLYTKNAAELIDIADIVVGTGRGLMEAAIAKKPVLAPVKNEELPILITEDNIEKIQKTNFSERLTVDYLYQEETINLLLAALKDEQRYAELCHVSQKNAAKYFDMDVVLPLYEKMYLSEQRSSLKIFDVLILWLGVVRVVIAALLSFKNR